jgi:hypothetical protein
MATALPELDIQRVDRWCGEPISAKFKREIHLEVITRGESISDHEYRPVRAARRMDQAPSRKFATRAKAPGPPHLDDCYGR